MRSLSWEGILVNLVYGIASGDTDLEEDFTNYYDGKTGQIQAVTPTMVSRLVKGSAKLVTQTLTSVGFEVEWRWVEISKDSKQVKKHTRAYCIPDSQTWAEIVSRYYYSEDEEGSPTIPEVLRSLRFYRVPGAVPSMPPVTSGHENSGGKTVGTLGTPYSTRSENNIKKPAHPCFACGSSNGGGGTVNGFADAAILILKEKPCSIWTCTGVGHPLPLLETRVLQPYQQDP